MNDTVQSEETLTERLERELGALKGTALVEEMRLYLTRLMETEDPGWVDLVVWRLTEEGVHLPEGSAMVSKLNAVTFSPGLIELSIEAEQRVEALKLELYEAEQRLPEEAPERLLLGRTLEKALRVSGVLAVFDNPTSPLLGTEHLDWAVTFVRSSDASLIEFINRHMHGGKAQADAAKVAQIATNILRQQPQGGRPSEAAALTAGYVPISLVARRSRLDARALNEAIDLLVMRGELGRTYFEHTPSAGRPTKCAVLFFTSWG